MFQFCHCATPLGPEHAVPDVVALDGGEETIDEDEEQGQTANG